MDKLLYEGSVKDIYQDGQDEKSLLFKFSDRYSIFDWGEMPDKIKDKGTTLSFFTYFIFDLLSKKDFWKSIESKLPTDLKALDAYQGLCASGIASHLIGYVDNKLSNQLRVKKVDVIKPDFQAGKWDYRVYKDNPKNCLVPLEVIFRFGVPKGSSLLKRVNNQEYAKELGLSIVPKEGDRFNQAIVEYSTKLEEKDRYLSKQVAAEIAGLSSNELTKLDELSKLLAYAVKVIFDSVGVELWDGKFEFAFISNGSADRDFMLVDAIGPDELRLTYQDVPLSKENLRQAYSGSPWQEAVSQAKNIAKDRNAINWKQICVDELEQTPPNISEERLEAYSMLYKSLANALFVEFKKEELFPEAWDLDTLSKKLKGYLT